MIGGTNDRDITRERGCAVESCSRGVAPHLAGDEEFEAASHAPDVHGRDGAAGERRVQRQLAAHARGVPRLELRQRQGAAGGVPREGSVPGSGTGRGHG